MVWTRADIADQSGRVAVVTGANSGTGKEIARELARAGARVIMACRNQRKAEQARRELLAQNPEARLDIVDLDLASLASVRRAAAEIATQAGRLDLLINNAGVMHLPRSLTRDGFETHLGANHLGHFALTCLLLPSLERQPDSRVVSTSSVAHRHGRLHLDDLNLERGYGRHKAYAQSKLACLMFAYHLHKRLTAAGSPTRSTAAHPGISMTALGENSLPVVRGVYRHGGAWMSTPAQGALCTLRAALDPGLTGHAYIGPSGRGEIAGDPVPVPSSRRSHDAEGQRRLWEASAAMTGIDLAHG